MIRRRSGWALVLMAIGCARGGDGPTVPPLWPASDTAVLRLTDSPVRLALQTYDGSGETVHPDFAAPRAPWKRRLFYLAITPYPAANPRFENPSLYASVDGVRWGGAPKSPQPIVTPDRGHLSDPDLVYASARGQLFLYYREASDSDRILMVKSSDGAQWSRPAPVFTGRIHSALSPAVVRRGVGDWWMWTVNAFEGCRASAARVELRRSTDGLAWGPPEPVSLGVSSTYFPWHLDVQWVPERSEYWALFPAKRSGSCVPTALYLATSPDGRAWRTFPTPVLVAGEIPDLTDVVYRSTFAYDARSDEVALWLSGAKAVEGALRWSTVAVRRPRAPLFATLARQPTRPAPRPARALVGRFAPP